MRSLNCYFILLLLVGSVMIPEASGQSLPAEIKVTKIYSDTNYNAFTSLVRFKGKFYCAFRSGQFHVYGRNGSIKIISSADGKVWNEVANLEADGYDLRDPKLSVSPDGKIVATIGGSVYEGKKLLRTMPLVAFSNKKGNKFSKAKHTRLDHSFKSDFDWLWRLTWHNGTGYGGVYGINPQIQNQDTSAIRLVNTHNGINYDLVTQLPLAGQPNETTIRVMPDGEMLLLIRREKGNKKAYLGKSKPPYTSWDYLELPFFVGGPDFIALDDNHFIGGGRINGKYTGLFTFTREGHFKEILQLPSNADSSYPGFVVFDGRLYLSYYSSHETPKTSIYLAEIPLSFFSF